MGHPIQADENKCKWQVTKGTCGKDSSIRNAPDEEATFSGRNLSSCPTFMRSKKKEYSKDRQLLAFKRCQAMRSTGGRKPQDE